MTALPSTPSFRLDGRRALVTGGSRGIGLAAAAALAEAGAEVTICARHAEAVDGAVAAMRAEGLAASGIALDVTDTAAVAAFVDDARPFDVLVNSAGTARHATLADITPADHAAVMDVNTTATLFTTQAVVRRMVAADVRGSIIHISSQMGHVGSARRIGYCTSKWAVEGMTRAMAIELGPHGIRVNAVCPTFVKTELNAASLSDPATLAWVLSNIRLGRLAELTDMMGPIVFLASDASAMVTGTSLLIDGGWTAG